MIKKFLKNFSLKGAERELADYSRKVSIGNSEQHGIILAHALLIFAQIIKKLPIAKEVVETKDDIYGAEIADLVLQTNSLLKQYVNAREMENAAGTKLLNETFHCLAHPELTEYGRDIWSYFAKSQKQAEAYLVEMEKRFAEQQNDSMVGKIREAKEYVMLVPSRFKA